MTSAIELKVAVMIKVSLPWYRPEAEREADDEQHDTAQGDGGNILDIRSTFLQAEVNSQHDQAETHHDTRLEKENTTTSLFNQES